MAAVAVRRPILDPFYSQAILTRSVNGSGASIGFTLTHPDGSFEQYDQAVGSQFFMTAVSDAAGNIVTLSYDAQMRIASLTDAIGQVTTLTYGLAGSPLVVTQITDPFGRSASFAYNSSGLLSSITDVLGITSSYSYGQGTDPDFINTLTTPYGSTSFTYGDSSTNGSLGSTRFLKTTDPLGRTSYVEFDGGIDAGDTSGGSLINSSLLPNGSVGGVTLYACNNYMQWRNTFVFDANQYALATAGGSLNYSLAHVIHWLHSDDYSNSSRVMESEKQPLENRVWYNYPGQSPGGCNNSILFPVSSGNVVSSGASSRPSAFGRVLDNGTTQVQTFQYNSVGNVTQATDAVGRQLTYTYAGNGIDLLTTSNTTSGSPQLLETRSYNSQHLPLTITGANGKTAKFAYNANGQPTKYTEALGSATTITYDGSGHLKTMVGAISTAKYSYTYDSVSRIASVTDPAGLIVHFAYDAADRPLTATYPDGSTTKLAYTLLDLTSTTDRLRQTTKYSHDADRELTSTTDPLGHISQQGYNLAGKLVSITDPNNHTTTFLLDAQSRITGKTYADGTSVGVAYESSISRVSTYVDALSQATDYTYNADNTIATRSYSNAGTATASVSFTYDPAYNRPKSMTDGNGTTTYAYNPVSATLGANQLESVTNPIAGTSNIDVVTYSYDALNRVMGMSVNGASQSTSFDALGRVISVSNPLDIFTYSYTDGTSRVSEESSNFGPTAALTYFGSSGDEQLEQISVTTHSGVISLAKFGYTYNADDNVVSLAVSSPSSQTTGYTYDAANRLLSGLFGAGSTPQYAYAYDAASNLTSITPNATQEKFAYGTTNAIATGTYNANGSPNKFAGIAYAWDGANRLVKTVNSANNTTSNFTYDGMNRLVRVTDTVNGVLKADHSYTWCGSVRCLAHDNTQSNSPVSTQYFDQGVIMGGTSYYYVQDQLGSVTHLVTTAGAVAAQYSYDPYGNRTNVSGTVAADIGYAGYFYHAASGFDFALFRAYDPAHARWVNRDPIDEAGGINLYAYANGNPVTNTDPLGLFVTSVDAACAIDPEFCAEIMGQIMENHGAITAMETGNQCLADEANRVANGFRTAGTIAGIAQLGSAAKDVAQVTINRKVGNDFRDELADLLVQAGRDVEIEVGKFTPFGYRFIDIEVSLNGVVLGGIEAKTGSSRYLPSQQLKDWYLRWVEDYPVVLVRK